jgi:hypothetical protein
MPCTPSSWPLPYLQVCSLFFHLPSLLSSFIFCLVPEKVKQMSEEIVKKKISSLGLVYFPAISHQPNGIEVGLLVQF